MKKSFLEFLANALQLGGQSDVGRVLGWHRARVHNNYSYQSIPRLQDWPHIIEAFGITPKGFLGHLLNWYTARDGQNSTQATSEGLTGQHSASKVDRRKA